MTQYKNFAIPWLALLLLNGCGSDDGMVDVAVEVASAGSGGNVAGGCIPPLFQMVLFAPDILPERTANASPVINISNFLNANSNDIIATGVSEVFQVPKGIGRVFEIRGFFYSDCTTDTEDAYLIYGRQDNVTIEGPATIQLDVRVSNQPVKSMQKSEETISVSNSQFAKIHTTRVPPVTCTQLDRVTVSDVATGTTWRGTYSGTDSNPTQVTVGPVLPRRVIDLRFVCTPLSASRAYRYTVTTDPVQTVTCASGVCI